jgi:O-antigen ligase
MFTEDINIIKISIILFLLFLYLSLVLVGKKKRLSISVDQILLIGSFLAIFIHSLIFSEELHASSLILVGVLWLILAYFIQIYHGRSWVLKKIDSSLYVFGITFILINIFAISLFGIQEFLVESNFRGITQNSNYLAVILTLIFPIYFCRYFDIDSKKKKTNILILACCITLILLTRSRTALISVFLTIAFYFGFTIRFQKKSLPILFKYVFFIFVGAIIIWQGMDLMLSKYDGQAAFSTREKLILLRLEAISQRPFAGWGFAVNKFTEYDQFHIYNAGEKGNVALAVLEELGIIFGSIVLAVISYIFYKSISRLMSSSKTRALGLVLFTSIVIAQAETWLFNFYGIAALIVWLIVFISLSNMARNSQ